MSVSLISTSTPAYANTSNQTTQRSVSNSVTSIASQQATKTAVSTDNAPPSSSADVVVMLSTQAMNASKTALTVTAEQKSFGQVALDARASMDSQYAAMKASGKPFDINKREGEDLYKLLGSLDRRSLYAVRSNEGGQFTKDEQDLAQILMSQQQGLAMGLYAGPTSKLASYVSPFSSASEGFKNGVRFLDSVSSEEKSSTKWAIERASAQIAYESAAENEHIAPEKLDSEDPIVQLITAAMKAMKHHPNSAWTTGPLTTADDLKRQPWFKGYESQLDQLMQQQNNVVLSACPKPPCF
jgi:hypothetical protein